MKEYDTACALYYHTLNIKCLALTSWEFRNEGFSDRILFEKLQTNWNTKQDFLQLSKKENKELIVTDKNFKIIFASNSISNLSGFNRKEILGKSPQMFQGEATCKNTKQKIAIAISQLKPFKEVLLNYRKNGDTYWCEIEAYPMFDKNGDFLNYIALEKMAS
jgi:PAS domain S-box-containing protein